MDPIEQTIVAAIDGHREGILDFARDIFSHAELGYKEFRTADKFASALRGLGLKVEERLAITGVKGYLKGGGSKPSLALIGELDALRIPEHPNVNPEIGAARACGHHAQLAGVLGAAIALSVPEVAASLDGEVVFFAVPAEEYGEIEFKNGLRDVGKIRYGGGKSELIRIGAFDDIDLGVVHHSGLKGVSVGGGSSNGFVSKVIRYIGKEAHAAAAPERGVNALNAATLGLAALGLQRETFRDEDSVRVHPILTRGGNLVNVVPNEAVVETLVRARTKEAIVDAASKTDRAFRAGAVATGASLVIETMPGYLPTIPAPANPLLVEAAREASGKEVAIGDPSAHHAASTDVGDLQHLKPVLSFGTGGVDGNLHSKDFRVVDEEEAYLVTAKTFALAAYKLLKSGAAGAREVVGGYDAPFTKEGYDAFMESLIKTERREPENA
jgi:amidohydrolase